MILKKARAGSLRPRPQHAFQVTKTPLPGALGSWLPRSRRCCRCHSPLRAIGVRPAPGAGSPRSAERGRPC